MWRRRAAISCARGEGRPGGGARGEGRPGGGARGEGRPGGAARRAAALASRARSIAVGGDRGVAGGHLTGQVVGGVRL